MGQRKKHRPTGIIKKQTKRLSLKKLIVCDTKLQRETNQQFAGSAYNNTFCQV